MANTKAQKKPALSWDSQSRKLMHKYANLTDQDLYFEQGQFEEMLTRLQAKIGKTRHEIFHMIRNL